MLIATAAAPVETLTTWQADYLADLDEVTGLDAEETRLLVGRLAFGVGDDAEVAAVLRGLDTQDVEWLAVTMFSLGVATGHASEERRRHGADRIDLREAVEIAEPAVAPAVVAIAGSSDSSSHAEAAEGLAEGFVRWTDSWTGSAPTATAGDPTGPEPAPEPAPAPASLGLTVLPQQASAATVSAWDATPAIDPRPVTSRDRRSLWAMRIF